MDKMSGYADQAKNDETSGGGGGGFAASIDIQKDVPNPIRLVDTPDGIERYYISWCCCDDGTRRPFIVENEKQGVSILGEMLGDRKNFYRGGILESVKDEATNSAKYIWEDKAPDLLLVIAYNEDASGKSGSWKSKEEYMFNAIQRNPDVDKETGQPFFWCKENKHTKLLKMGRTAFLSLQDVRMNDGNPSEYDINYLKRGSGFSTKHTIHKAGN